MAGICRLKSVLEWMPMAMMPIAAPKPTPLRNSESRRHSACCARHSASRTKAARGRPPIRPYSMANWM
ncbi:hypothetical protein D3C80_1852770 [compost metagenome]